MATIEQNNLIGNYLPNIRFQKIIIEDANSSLQTTLGLVAKERFPYKNPQGTWLRNQDVLNKTKIKVIQSLSVALTKGILNNELDVSKNVSDIEGLEEQIISIIPNVLPTSWDEKRNTYYRYVDEEGNEIFDIPYSVIFNNDGVTNETGTNPSHLSYFAFTYQDIFDNNIEGSDNAAALRGQIACETVFNNFSYKSSGTIFYTQENKIWTGAVFKTMNGGYAKGDVAKKINMSDRLIPVNVSNPKIQDMRAINNIKNASTIETNGAQEFSTEAFSTAGESTAYFSDLYIAKDQSGNVRFTFGIDVVELYKHLSPHGFLFENQIILDELLSRMKIVNLSIYNFLSAGEETTPIKIFEGAETSPGVFPATSYFVEKTDTLSSTVKEASLSLDQSSINKKYRHFDGIDLNMSTVGSGVGSHFYGVEITIQDQTLAFLKEKRDELKDCIVYLEEYYNDSLESYNKTSDKFVQEVVSCGVIENSVQGELGIEKCLDTYAKNASIIYNSATTAEIFETTNTLLNLTHPTSGSPDGILTFIGLLQEAVDSISELIGTNPNMSSSQNGQNESGTTGTEPFTNLLTYTKIFDDSTEMLDTNSIIGNGLEFILGKDAQTNNDGLVEISQSAWESRLQEETEKYYNTSGVDQTYTVEGLDLNFSLANQAGTFLSPSYGNSNSNVFDMSSTDKDFVPFLYDVQSSMLLSLSPEIPSDFDPNTFYKIAQGGVYGDEFTEKDADQCYADFTAGTSLSAMCEGVLEQYLLEESAEDIPDDADGGVTIVDTEDEKDYNSDDKSGGSSSDADDEAGTDNTGSSNEDLAAALETVLSYLICTGVLYNWSTYTTTADIEDFSTWLASAATVDPNTIFDISSSGNLSELLTNDEILALPPQVLSLLLDKNLFYNPSCDQSDDDIVAGAVESDCGFLLDVNNCPQYDTLINNIHIIQALTGYGSGIKDPIWEDLTNENYKTLVGSKLFRIIPYYNSSLGVGGSAQVWNFPVFNQHFIFLSSIAAPLQISSTPKVQYVVSNEFVQPEYVYTANQYMMNSALETVDSDNIEQYNSLAAVLAPQLNKHGIVTKANQYTSGGEYVLSNGNEYKGYYHIHQDGTVMTLRDHIPGISHDTLTPITKITVQPVAQTATQMVTLVATSGASY